MKIPEKFKINTKDFKIYFDNEKKTHVCENLNTGEKTNIGVIGILMQMGILKPVEDKATEEKLALLSERISRLESKIDDLNKNLDGSMKKPEVEETPEEDEVKEKPKSKMNERIMKKILENTEKEEVEEEVEDKVEEEQIEETETEEEPEEPEESDVVNESDEEIDNWMEI